MAQAGPAGGDSTVAAQSPGARAPGSVRSRALRALMLFLLLLCATLLLTWPLAVNLRTMLPFTHFVAQTDALVAGWLLSWESHALATAPWSIAEANIFHPTPHALFYGPTGLGALPLFAPVFWVSGNATLALNVTLIAGIALTAWAMTLVVLRWTGSLGAGVIAGWVVLMNEWLVRGMVPTAPFAAALMYFPPILYLGARARGWQVLWLVPLVALQCSVDIAYVAPAVLGPLGLIALWRLIRRDMRADGLRLTTALVLSVLALVPLLAGYAAVRRDNPSLDDQSVWFTLKFPTALSTFVFDGPREASLPLLLLLTLGSLLLAHRIWRGDAVDGDVHIAGSRAALRQLWAHGLLWTIVGFVLSLPPSVLVGGGRVVTPMGWLQQVVPALAVLRTRNRLAVACLMGIALLAGAAVAEVEAWLARRREIASRPSFTAAAAAPASRGLTLGLVLLACAMFLFSAHSALREGTLLKPFPMLPPPRSFSPEALAVLRASPGPVLEFPIPNLKKNPAAYARTMYRSADYGFRPLLNGHHSYFPKDHPTRMALAAQVPAPDALAALRRETGVTTIAVVLDYLLPVARGRWEAIAAAPPPSLKLLFRSPDELIFAVK